MTRKYTVSVRNTVEQTTEYHVVLAETVQIFDDEIIFKEFNSVDCLYVVVGVFTKHPDVIYSITSQLP